MNKWWLIIVVAVIAFPTGALAQAAITGLDIVDGSITAVDLGRGVVRTSKIYTGAVKTSKLGSRAVTTEKIADGAVTRTKVRMTDKTKYLSIVGSAFRPNRWYADYEVSETGALESISYEPQFFQAPVQLPGGARITNLRYQAWDYQSTEPHPTPRPSTLAKLVRRTKTGSAYEMGLAGPSTYSTTWKDYNDATIFDTVIDNANNFYFVEVRLWRWGGGLNQRAGGVRISYTEKSL